MFKEACKEKVLQHYQTKEPGKSDFYFLNTVKEGGNGPLVRKLGVISKCPVGIREALGTVVGIFLQSFLDIRPKLEREHKQVRGALV